MTMPRGKEAPASHGKPAIVSILVATGLIGSFIGSITLAKPEQHNIAMAAPYSSDASPGQGTGRATGTPHTKPTSRSSSGDASYKTSPEASHDGTALFVGSEQPGGEEVASPKKITGMEELSTIPSRTSMAVITDHGELKTDNAAEPRSGLSIVKLYLADYALTHTKNPKKNVKDVARMIRYSDDDIANKLIKKYPYAIDVIAQEYGLSNTRQGKTWGQSLTSATDVAKYLNAVKKKRPHSLILGWMRDAAPIASDGTRQDWGTANLPGVTGTKWGWSAYGDPIVASASIADNYVAVAFTEGGPTEQNIDVRSVIPYLE
ncbi:hypothetical protein [Corynebacterium anserum]|uniref:Uncharacterized protein n=1 Tax=Corynebacterium anserum TaxID=2684406 RepID=A0A7G7YMN1_9CORY|nr:hypothetical protein [Corynebacterium anserum]MBC2681123.1 hypothetical protein [Corynebacterium anserum]QNH95751.1 hypothetical protein GP473_02820 [Corynebacterium anserum]